MATTKKTVKTDNKKTTAKKTTTKKKPITKVKKEESGVVDEFLNENIGGVITVPEEPQEQPQGIVTKYANTEVDAEKYKKIKVFKPVEENENTINKTLDKNEKEEALIKRWEELGLTDDLQENIQETVSNLYEQSQDLVKAVEENNKPTENKEQIVQEQPRFVYVNSFMGANYD